MSAVWKSCGADDFAAEQAVRLQTEQHDRGQRGVEERRLRAQQPAACGELREEQDRQRRTGAAAGDHDEREEEDVAGKERQQRLRKRQRQPLLLNPGERRKAEHEIQRRRGDERIGRRDVDRAKIEQQREPEQQRAADRAEHADDPQDAP